jgi:hypothetical protein
MSGDNSGDHVLIREGGKASDHILGAVAEFEPAKIIERMMRGKVHGSARVVSVTLFSGPRASRSCKRKEVGWLNLTCHCFSKTHAGCSYPSGLIALGAPWETESGTRTGCE